MGRCRNIALIFPLLIGTLGSIEAQQIITRDQAEASFKDRLSTLHPLEGIWHVTLTTTTYGPNGTIEDSKQSELDWGIVRDEKGFFVNVNLDAEPSSLVHSFVIAPDSRKVTVRAYMKNTNNIYTGSFEFDSSERFDFEYQVLKTPLGRRIIASFHCEKTFPTPQDIEKASIFSGTCFRIPGTEVYVTNTHVIAGSSAIGVIIGIGDSVLTSDARLISSDPQNDLSLISVSRTAPRPSRYPFIIRTTSAEVGEEVFILGYPLPSSMGSELKLTTGVVSSTSGFQGDPTCYQISAPAQPGNSGGPVFDKEGRLIAVVSSRHEGAQNVSYAIKSKYLVAFLTKSIGYQDRSLPNPLRGKSLVEQVRAIRDDVLLVAASGD